MTTTLLLSVALAPLILVAFATGRHGPWLAAIAPLPALGVASFGSSPEVVVLEGVLFGVRMGLDETGRVFLMTSSLVWVVAAVYAAGSLRHSPAAGRFRVFFQLAMTGNLVLILAQDMVTFFLGFTLMGLSAYGLVAHQQTVAARRAGRLYLRWTILGEVSLFCALVFAHHLMVKSALFIGIDLLDRGKARAWVMTGLVLLGLALIGAPLTSGALAKATLVNGLPESAAWFGS